MRSLSEREEAILQALEILTRVEGDTWLKWTDLREQVRLLDLTEETMASGTWIQNTLKRLQLLDRSSKRSSAKGRTVKVDRGKVVDTMLRYQVSTVQ